MNCVHGTHSNRGLTKDMCPVFLMHRRATSRRRYRELSWDKRADILIRTNRNRLRKSHDW